MDNLVDNFREIIDHVVDKCQVLWITFIGEKQLLHYTARARVKLVSKIVR